MTVRPLLAASFLLASTAAGADPLLDQVVAVAKATPPAAFERTTIIEASDGKQAQTVRRVDRYDPKAPEERRWTLVSVNGAAPAPKDLEAYRKQILATPAPGYYRIATFLRSGAQRVGEANGRVTYRIPTLPKGSVKGGPMDLSGLLSAEVVVDQTAPKPVVSRIRFFLPKPTRVMLVAKLDRFEAISDYGLSNGAPAIVAQVTEMVGTNPMQGSGTQRTRVSFRAL